MFFKSITLISTTTVGHEGGARKGTVPRPSGLRRASRPKGCRSDLTGSAGLRNERVEGGRIATFERGLELQALFVTPHGEHRRQFSGIAIDHRRIALLQVTEHLRLGPAAGVTDV